MKYEEWSPWVNIEYYVPGSTQYISLDYYYYYIII